MSGNLAETPPPKPNKVKKEPIPLETLLVEEDASRELLCGICLQILSKPRQCKNGHLFCLNCIMQHIQKNPECPQCRCPLKESDLARSLFVEKHLSQLQVYCKYHFYYEEKDKVWLPDEQGCSEKFTMENASKHQDTCLFAKVRCSFSQRCGKIRKRDIEAHQSACPFKPLECEFCKQPIESKRLQEHIGKCDMVDVSCENCTLELKRGELEAHQTNDCPNQLISCQFYDQGCQVKVLRKDLNEHLAQEVGNHLMMIKKGFDNELALLKANFETQTKIRDEKIRQLEKCISDTDTRIDWRVKNWSSAKKKSYLQSDKFYFADFSWFLGFYTDGDNEESRGYISVYLFLDTTSLPKSKTATIEFTLRFINHKDPAESVRKEFKTTFPIRGGQGWGDRKVIKASRLSEETGFLKQDALYVEATLSLKRVTWTI